MPSIRDVVAALERREGVDAVLVVGPDGLPIDARADGVDLESVAALLPGVVRAVGDFAAAAGRGAFSDGVLQCGEGLAVVSVLNADATLVLLVKPRINVGGLLFDLHRHRSALAGLL
jgi:predicted regulator of Ras-like GTPase activity (Roadblock/LC7/MglB family)